MPTYRYECPCQGGEFWVDHGINDSRNKCPGCGRPVAEGFRKLIPTGVGFNEASIRIPAERAPAYTAWARSDETIRKLRLPSGHPEALTLAQKGSDEWNDVGFGSDSVTAPTTTEADIAKH